MNLNLKRLGKQNYNGIPITLFFNELNFED